MSPGTPVSSTNKTDSHDIAKLLLKVALNTITLTTTLTLIYNDEIIFININYFKSGNLINGLFLVNLYLFLMEICLRTGSANCPQSSPLHPKAIYVYPMIDE